MLQSKCVYSSAKSSCDQLPQPLTSQCRKGLGGGVVSRSQTLSCESLATQDLGGGGLL